MTRSEILQTAKPILFNTDMVREILDGRKTVTRRGMKPQPIHKGRFWMIGGAGWSDDIQVIHPVPCHSLYKRMPYKPGDILYVRETWGISNIDYDDKVAYIVYRASKNEKDEGCRAVRLPNDKFEKLYDSIAENMSDWRPSIHMPKEAARIFLRVTDVRVERLQEITEQQAKCEGAIDNRGFIHSPDNEYTNIHNAKEHYKQIWDSTIPKKDLDKYGWDANPWVWVIEFERVEVKREAD